jgi:hypothetical protein
LARVLILPIGGFARGVIHPSKKFEAVGNQCRVPAGTVAAQLHFKQKPSPLCRPADSYVKCGKRSTQILAGRCDLVKGASDLRLRKPFQGHIVKVGDEDDGLKMRTEYWRVIDAGKLGELLCLCLGWVREL